MVLQRWDTLAEIRRMEHAINRVRSGHRTAGYEGSRWNIPLDVVQQDDEILVRASVPGVDADGINVTLEDGLLTIEGETASESEVKESDYLLRERRVGRFHRALRLPNTVDADKARSSYDNGVLTISVPKQEAKKARRLEVKSG